MGDNRRAGTHSIPPRGRSPSRGACGSRTLPTATSPAAWAAQAAWTVRNSRRYCGNAIPESDGRAAAPSANTRRAASASGRTRTGQQSGTTGEHEFGIGITPGSFHAGDQARVPAIGRGHAPPCIISPLTPPPGTRTPRHAASGARIAILQRPVNQSPVGRIPATIRAPWPSEARYGGGTRRKIAQRAAARTARPSTWLAREKPEYLGNRKEHGPSSPIPSQNGTGTTALPLHHFPGMKRI